MRKKSVFPKASSVVRAQSVNVACLVPLLSLPGPGPVTLGDHSTTMPLSCLLRVGDRARCQRGQSRVSRQALSAVRLLLSDAVCSCHPSHPAPNTQQITCRPPQGFHSPQLLARPWLSFRSATATVLTHDVKAKGAALTACSRWSDCSRHTWLVQGPARRTVSD